MDMQATGTNIGMVLAAAAGRVQRSSRRWWWLSLHVAPAVVNAVEGGVVRLPRFCHLSKGFSGAGNLNLHPVLCGAVTLPLLFRATPRHRGHAQQLDGGQL